MRRVLAILIGYCVFGVSAVVLFQLAHVDPHRQPGIGFMIGSVVYGIIFAAAAGYTAARIAGNKELVNGAFVAGIIAFLALVSILAQPGIPSYWSQIAAIVCMAPAAVLGGWLRARQSRPPMRK
jgi:uncharacterized oligopeptide transporter (OPT) family protein